jgi:glycosyltransferase involved in cell wall biosynthesis
MVSTGETAMIPTPPDADAGQRTPQCRPLVLHTRVVTGEGGGPDKTILNSARYLMPFGYDTLCAYMHPPGDPGFEELRKKAQLYHSPLAEILDRGPLDIGVAGRLLRLCPRDRTIIWHGHDYKSNTLGLLLRPWRKLRLVTTVHGWGVLGGRTGLYYMVDRLCLRHYERVICVCEELQARCVAAGVPAERCCVIENAVDTEQFARRIPAEEARRRLGWRPERLVIGAVGRLSEEKNFPALIRAVDHMIAQGDDVELVLVGEGPKRQYLESLIAELNRGDRIRLLGYRADTADLYQAMNLLALSSLREGLPNTLLEAMACEVPVVATRIAGIPRLVDDGQNGLLVAPGDWQPLAQALRCLVADAALRRRLADEARRTIMRAYTFETRMEKVRAVYGQLLDSGASGS